MRKILVILMVCTLFLASCNTTVSKNPITQEKSKQEVDGNASIDTTGSLANLEAMEIAETKDYDVDVGESIVEYDQDAFESEPAYGEPITWAFGGAPCVAGAMIAQKLGFAEREGIEFEFVAVQAQNEALGSGQIDGITTHIAMMLVPVVNGVDAYILGGAMTGCQDLVVLKDSEIQSTQDLIGRKIGLPRGIGSQDHNIVLRFLNKDGVSPDDVTFTNVESSAIIQSLESGEIDAAVTADQFNLSFIEEGTLRRIRSLTWDEDFENEVCCANWLNGDFARDNPIHAKKIASLLSDTELWINEHPDEAAEMSLDLGQASADFEIVRYMVDSYNWDVNSIETEQTLKDVFNDYKQFGVIETDMTAQEFLDKHYLPVSIKEDSQFYNRQTSSLDSR